MNYTDDVLESDYPETVEMINKLFALHPQNQLPLNSPRWGKQAELELFDILASEARRSTFRELILDNLADNDVADMIIRCDAIPSKSRATPAELLGFFQEVRNEALKWILDELIHNIGVRR